MISKIKAWFKERRLKKRRSLFRYWTGSKYAYADPFKVWRAILNHPKFNVETMAYLVDEGAEPETTICVESMCEVFGVTRWNSQDGTGLTDMEIIALLDRFDAYLDALKKNSSRGVTSSAPTDSESSASKEAQSPATNSSSDATSTSTEQSFVGE